jgi:hypothetical protein
LPDLLLDLWDLWDLCEWCFLLDLLDLLELELEPDDELLLLEVFETCKSLKIEL